MNNPWWEDLSKYESRDFIGKWYNNRHSRKLNAARSAEINCCFTQGRQYFEAATSAALGVQPLLLYYGVLALSRGIILLKDITKKEESLKPSHGVEVVDWRSDLSKGLEHVLSLKVRATDGTFGELMAAAGNSQPTAYWLAPSLNEVYYYAQFPRPSFSSDGTTLTLDDLLSRDPRFLSLYSSTTGRPAKAHLCEIIANLGGYVDVGVYGPPFSSAELTPRFNVPATTPVTAGIGQRMMVPALSFRLTGSDMQSLQAKLPATIFHGNDGLFVIDDFPNGDRLSELARTFLLSYILGMLVRYFPSRWIALQRNERGDVAQPLLLAASKRITQDFPKLVVEALS